MNDIQKKWKRLLSHYKMNKPELIPESVIIFNDFTEEIKHVMVGLISSDINIQLNPVVDKLIEQINATVQYMSMGCIMKKIAVVHALMHKLKLKELIDPLIKSAYSQLNTIITKNLQQIALKTPQKRQSSLSKMQGLIRKLSGSKQRSSSKTGRMNLQNQNQKGALLEIVNKIVKPFCIYLLKLTENSEFYSIIKSSKKDLENVVLWKLVNWSKALGSIIMQVHRLSRYFKDDILSLSIFMNYLISMDISEYYDAIKKHVDKQSQKWRQKIKRSQKDVEDSCKLNEEEIQLQMSDIANLIKNKELLELKELINETRNIKQKLNYIYGNSILVSWNQYFTRPTTYSFNNKATKQQANIDFILQFFEKHNRAKSRKTQPSESYYGKFQSISLCNTEQTVSKDSPNKEKKQQKKTSSLKKEMISNSQLFDEVEDDNSLLTKIQKVKMSKTRLNKFINSNAQKLKLINQLAPLKNQEVNKIQYRIPNK